MPEPWCLHSNRDDHEPFSDEWYESVASEDLAHCWLPQGHEGPHEYQRDDEVSLRLTRKGKRNER